MLVSDQLDLPSLRKTDKPVILLVEDDPAVREIMAHIIGRFGTVVQAEDGEEGLRLARRIRPILIISDMEMPRMNGDQFVSRLRCEAELQRTPVILTSGYSPERVRSSPASTTMFLQKPFTVQEVNELVNAVIQSHSE